MTTEDAILLAVHSLKESVDAGIKGVQANVTANADVTNLRLQQLEKRFDEMDEWKKGIVVECQKRKNETETVRKVKKNRIWYLAGLVLFVITVVVIYDNIGLRGLFHLFDMIK